MLFQMTPLALTWSDLERSKWRSRIFRRAVTWKRLQMGPCYFSILPYILSLSPNHIRGGGSPTGPLAGPVALVTVFVFVLSHSQVAGWSAYSTAKFPSSKLSSTNKNRTMWLIENRELT